MNNDVKHLRRTGLSVATLAALVAGVGLYRGHTTTAIVAASASGILIALAVIRPMSLGPVERLLRIVGQINTSVILAAAYLVLIVPTGAIRRIAGGRTLTLRPDANKATYWHKHETAETSSSFTRQY